MIYPKCLTILGFLISSASCDNTVPIARVEVKDGHVNDTTGNMTFITVTTVKLPINIQSIIPTINNTTNISSTVKTRSEGKRRAVLYIYSPSELHQIGRQKKKQEKGPGAVQSLQYVEYNDDGSVLAEFTMHNMEDVSRFFENVLHTQICHGSC